MKKLIEAMEAISECGPDITFSLRQIGLAESFWQAEVTVNYTDLFDEKDFDETYVIDAIEERYMMLEVSKSPSRAIQNLSRRLKKVNKKFGYEE